MNTSPGHSDRPSRKCPDAVNGRSVSCYLVPWLNCAPWAPRRIDVTKDLPWFTNEANCLMLGCSQVSFCTTLYLAGIQTEMSVLTGVPQAIPSQVDAGKPLQSLQLGQDMLRQVKTNVEIWGSHAKPICLTLFDRMKPFCLCFICFSGSNYPLVFFVAKADTFSDVEWSHNDRGSGRLVSPLPDTVRYDCHLLPFLSQLCQVSVQTTEAPATESNSESRQFQGRVYLGVISCVWRLSWQGNNTCSIGDRLHAPKIWNLSQESLGCAPRDGHVELCSCWLQSLHGMFNLIPLAGAQQVTWPHYFTFRFFENTADVQFWAILERSLHMCGHPSSSKCAIRCRDFWRKGICFGLVWK